VEINDMNIFYLDSNPKTCAEMHHDKHCSKMLVEYAQLMSTAHRVLDGVQYTDRTLSGRRIQRWHHNNDDDLYKASHINHPSNLWLRLSKNNYKFLYEMWCHLHDEFLKRYGKPHMSYTKLHKVLANPPKNCGDMPFTQPAQTMPEDVKHQDSIIAYRNYYIKYKKDFATWRTSTPAWYKTA